MHEEDYDTLRSFFEQQICAREIRVPFRHMKVCLEHNLMPDSSLGWGSLARINVVQLMQSVITEQTRNFTKRLNSALKISHVNAVA